ncbi:uncharacterized protein LOC134189986 [Corticium candelabrum]|uniref:uncharacterized protein LOC134189986 n=1 Tax=Corticium candelabrum TaxID=121492 RepID=UPI002E25B4FD|nr:uncharacterized protein LOC134189986 [Corticium candelabrum]
MSDVQEKKTKRKKREKRDRSLVDEDVEGSPSNAKSRKSKSKKGEKVGGTPGKIAEFRGFTRADVQTLCGQLSYETAVADNKELWLLKIPFDMDPSRLTNTKVVLGIRQNLVIKNENEKRVSCEVSSQSTDRSASCHCLLASEDGTLLPAQLTGHITITRRIHVPQCSPVKDWTGNEAKRVIPSELKQRWKPFGCGNHTGSESVPESSTKTRGKRKLFSPTKRDVATTESPSKRKRRKSGV